MAAPAYATGQPDATQVTVSVAEGETTINIETPQGSTPTITVNGKPVTPGAATPDPPPSEPVEKPEEPPASSVADEIVRLANEARAAEGLPAYTVDPCLMQSAQKVTETMAAEQDLKHSDLSGIRECGFYGSENIANGYENPEEVHDGWMGSTEGHREAILSPEHVMIGVGYAEAADGTLYYTQHFADPKEDTK